MEKMDDLQLKAEIEEISKRIDNTIRSIEDLNIRQSETSEESKD